jgi:predicted nucleic acid-binding Zn ribbon protein
VGPAIAAAARPSGERDGVLTVTCAAAVWAHELDLMAPELLARLNGALGADALSRLRCRSV